ncbi:MAG: hypothetical protein RLZZ628_780 [Bacteroidota bacterium]|jgi:hypothetical protein
MVEVHFKTEDTHFETIVALKRKITQKSSEMSLLFIRYLENQPTLS